MRPHVRRALCMLFGVMSLTLIWIASAFAQATLDQVRKRGTLVCGVSEGLTGFSERNEQGQWAGFDVDFCRAVAAATLDDPGKVKYVPLSAQARFSSLSRGEVDLLARNTTWTMSWDITLGLDFVGPSYFDGQGFLVPVSSGIRTAAELNNKTICFLEGTTIETNLRRHLDANRLSATFLTAGSRSDVRSSYAQGLCQAYVSDLSALASERTRLADPDAHILLPELIAKEPLGPVVREDDPKWRDLVQWVLFLLVNAEEAGWTAERARERNLAPLVEVPAAVTLALNLRAQWPRSVIAQVGNYGEVFERNLGRGSQVKISRGLNDLWTRGGLLFAPPIR